MGAIKAPSIHHENTVPSVFAFMAGPALLGGISSGRMCTEEKSRSQLLFSDHIFARGSNEGNQWYSADHEPMVSGIRGHGA